jgi:hypothetical protein
MIDIENHIDTDEDSSSESEDSSSDELWYMSDSNDFYENCILLINLNSIKNLI